MIVYDLSCSEGHRFEGWFSSSSDYSDQKAQGLLQCPACGCEDVGKAPMAPSVPAKANAVAAPAGEKAQLSTGDMPPAVKQAFEALAKAQAKALESSTWVGDCFAEKAREMHYGESENAPIHGRATRDEAEDMVAEGIAVAPLMVPVAPPDELN